MPSSRYEHISDVVSLIRGLAPHTVLDAGCGFGRWGFLAREYLDVFEGRYEKKAWKAQIDAIEVNPGYLCPHHRYIYDRIYVGRIEDYVQEMSTYDVIIAGDVIEHFAKSDGEKTLLALYSKCAKALIVALPLGDRWPQGEVFGNPYETHRSIWTEEDLTRLGAKYVRIYRVDRSRPYALAVWTERNLPELEKRSWRLARASWRCIQRSLGWCVR